MKPSIHPTKRLLIALAAIVLFSTGSIFGQNPQSTAQDKSPARPLNMLVLGDSITWGQGLKDEHKAWHRIKTWLQETTGRDVRERIEAHSGAVIGSDDGRLQSVPPLDGEINRALPSVNNQVDAALTSYADPTQVDLVLVDGCINDVDARRLLNAVNTPDEIQQVAEAKCGALVEDLLHRIAASFPNAHVIVTGYFPIISEETSNDFLMKALVKRLYTPAAGAPRMSSKELRARLIAVSKEWYLTSSRWLAAATGKVDAQQAAKGSRRRVLFAPVAFLPEHSFRARKSRLWGFDASFLRKVLIVLTLGKVGLRTNDERRNQRDASCKEALKPAPGETKNEKRYREGRLALCRVAAIGHPNREGAAMYAEAISRQLQPLIKDSGWLKEKRALASPASVAR